MLTSDRPELFPIRSFLRRGRPRHLYRTTLKAEWVNRCLVVPGKDKVTMDRSTSWTWRSGVLAGCFLICRLCAAQQAPPGPTPAPATPPSAPAQATPAPLPDAPGATPNPNQPTIAPDDIEPKRIMGLMPNFRSVSRGAVVPPTSVREKFRISTLDNFDYTSLFFAGVIAADSMATKATPEFHQGAAGFARYYWHTVADQSVENYFVEFIIPSINHEDSRYYAMGREGGGFFKRTGYSLSRIVVTRSDKGKPMFNYAEIVGSGISAPLSSLYYPSKERNIPTDFRNWGLDITYDAATFVFHEFWPDISNAVFGKKGSKAVTAAKP
jgi:hypothetical protein